MIDPALIDQATMDTLLGQMMNNYHMSRADAQDILQDVMLKLVVWYRNNADTDKFKGGTIRMSIPFIRTAIRNRIIDGRTKWYTEGRQMYRQLLGELREAAQEGPSSLVTPLCTPLVARMAWSMDSDLGDGSLGGGAELTSGTLSLDTDLVRWLGGLTDAMSTAVLGRHVLEMTRAEIMEMYPDLYSSEDDVSTCTKKGLAYLKTRAKQENVYGSYYKQQD